MGEVSTFGEPKLAASIKTALARSSPPNEGKKLTRHLLGSLMYWCHALKCRLHIVCLFCLFVRIEHELNSWSNRV